MPTDGGFRMKILIYVFDVNDKSSAKCLAHAWPEGLFGCGIGGDNDRRTAFGCDQPVGRCFNRVL